ncbi:MAG: hypothetical protein EOO15_06170 [Chitinophagaceae bacterium]|nr:MAG: hypothetical protein EOO15_06170 [Chitinophagaceae bacterium]
MSKHMRPFLLSLALLVAGGAGAQSFETAGQYMEYINKAHEKVTSMYLSYLSAIGHGKSARKVEKRQQEVVNTLFDTRMNVMGMPPFKGDRAYRDTTVAYLKLLYAVFNEDYAKIVNMEEIAEQSYDAMEAYMLAQRKASERLDEAGTQRQKTFSEFAAKYNVTIVDGTSSLEEKSKEASQLMAHYDEVFLIFFKAHKQEGYLMDALMKKNLTAFEQSRTALKKFADEGLKKLPAVKAFRNDPALVNACTTALQFFQEESDKMTAVTEFLLAQENFEKLKKAFNAKPASQRTQKDIDDYNNGVNSINALLSAFNQSNNDLNRQRSKSLDTWNDAVKKYLDEYMPYQRRG